MYFYIAINQNLLYSGNNLVPNINELIKSDY